MCKVDDMTVKLVRATFAMCVALGCIALGSITTENRLVGQDWIKVPLSRDTWISNFSTEQFGSNGGATRLKIKSIMELSIIDFQPSLLQGKKILGAKLYLMNAGTRPIERVSISTITSDWVEGNGTNYQVIEGVSTFSHRLYPTERWYKSDFTNVCIGQGNSIYSSVDAMPTSTTGWVELNVPAELLQARLHGLSYGLVLMDDTGSTWTRNGEEFIQEIFPNRFVYSQNSNASTRPYLMVQVAPEDPAATEVVPAPESLAFAAPDAKDPRPRLTWTLQSPSGDQTFKKPIGFSVEREGVALPPYFVPSIRSDRNGVFTLPLDVLETNQIAAQGTFVVRTIAEDGTKSESKECQASSGSQQGSGPSFADLPSDNLDNAAGAPVDWVGSFELASTQLTVIDPLDSYLPVSNQSIPGHSGGYFTKNHLWDASQRQVTLDCGRGSWMGFQVVSKRSIAPKLFMEWDNTNTPLSASKKRLVEYYRYGLVPKGTEKIPDPLIQMLPAADGQATDGKGANSWLVEIYIPPEMPAGTYRARLRIRIGTVERFLKVSVKVHNVIIPKTLSFLPEMNCYGLPTNDMDYYRLAQRHRTVLNRVPYNQAGAMSAGCSPVWNNGNVNWTNYDLRYGKLFTGEAFKDLPRGAIPIECFYLPMHENWPLPIDSHYNGSYWADQAFTPEYRAAWADSVRQFMNHFEQKKWVDTRFHIYLNNKNSYKSKGWSRGSSPWLLDEPVNFQDFWAIRYFGLAYLDGLQASDCFSSTGTSCVPRMVFRADVSRPQWQRDTFDEFLEYNVVSQDSFRSYRPLVLDRKHRFGQETVLYGSNNPVGTSNAMAVAWSWDSWGLGADGVLPWQTIGNANSWNVADELALFYPSNVTGQTKPVPSIRLKAYCYGQQDVELLNKITQKYNCDRYAFGQDFRQKVKLQAIGRTEGNYLEPASWSDYGNLSIEMLHKRRIEMLQFAAAGQN
jgi:hypothetical protein